jgi:GntR family transcriptional regulator
VDFLLDTKSGVPFYRQIILQVEMAIADNRLKAGDQLPTVRGLAVDLKVNPNTVARAYSQLELLGYVTTQQGTGTFISTKEVDFSEVERQRILARISEEFLAKAASYGFAPREIIKYLQEEK